MAPGKPAAEFNAIINADRQRRKNEALAEEIFTKNRRSSAPGSGITNRKPGTGPSLASRIGISKRTASNSPKPSLRQPAKPQGRPTGGDVDAEWTHDLHPLNNPSASRASQLPPHSRSFRANRNDNLRNALSGSASSPALNSQFNIVGAKKAPPQISIRGLAGPYVVMAKNFVQGTTVADIESAMTPVGGVALSCRIIAERPNVIAEIVFETKEGADNVVETFNNQNADGNILHVYHKIGGPAPTYPVARAAPATRSEAPLGPRADTLIDRVERSKPAYGASDRYIPRGRSRDRRRDYESREEITDGSYGFDDQMDTDDYDNNREKGQGGLYSDSMVDNRGRGRANSRERGRGGDRGRSYR